ncbi:NosR/NirI family nitrous oxide reductase transcriptional regulator [Amaricoccus macauensis]|uniref:NosR/NirI family nitrous oxide reductase transcriptional regulator n=1 Tax=Amaricoccus macauensis TaxID=57001 RepID=A0A840SYY4_9RHOB|nr:NosR/NirI family protein [Amaricoccus macauensis]MBB5224272.1 NosR/NirI family nitrous oxide reductase transcriptional regulator [Amaricoccus macauensis]
MEALKRLAALLTFALCLALGSLAQAKTLGEFLADASPADLFPGAASFGPAEGTPPLVPVLDAGGERLGWVYLNTDYTTSVGYSGKPIRILVGIDPAGTVRGLKLVEHHEPIVLIGIPEPEVMAALNDLIGTDLGSVAAGQAKPPQVDIVSGATVTVLVMGDSVVRSAVKLIRSGRLSGDAATAAAPLEVRRELDPAKTEVRDWASLVGDGSVRSLQLTVGEVSQAFTEAGQPVAAAHPETANPDDRFIELYVAPVSVPAIGRSLLGDAAYDRLASKLRPGQAAILVAGDGAYSFKGSAYVRGGIFDRIELLQDGQGIRFRDRNHSRLNAIAAAGAPRLKEIGLFVVPEDFAFDVTEPFDIQLLVQRAADGRDKATIPFDLGYTLPERYLLPAPPPPAPAAVAAGPAPAPAGLAEEEEGPPLWVSIWEMNRVQIGVVVAALLALTGIFFFQNTLARRPRLLKGVRYTYLAFTLVWLGWYAHTQLSVVNILTFFNALVTGFSWEFFLTAPLVFILWAAVAAGLLFWGRGPFCGWLCPFGALQEFASLAAKKLRIPQIQVPWSLHERLWPIKYMIFLGLFGLSFYSLAHAERLSEVEPFKTAIVLRFDRELVFIGIALLWLLPGLFIERFFCRYVCPLGAALAIPGRLRMFEWLKRWPECGSPCHRCANECPVQAIHPEGQINVNECIYCMHCQELYHSETRCPHMMVVKARRDKIAASNAPSAPPVLPRDPRRKPAHAHS